MAIVDGKRLITMGIVTLLVCCFFSPPPLYAGEGDLTAASLLKFVGGMVTAFSLHEGGHALAGVITDTDMEWELGTYNQPILFVENSDTRTDGFIINSAGFLFQTAGAETILQVDKINKNDAFVRGMMTWNIINPILYALDYWLFHFTSDPNAPTYEGDLQGLEYYSDKTTADIVAAAITVIALFQGYRYVKTQSWAPAWLNGKTRDINVLPLSPGGVLLQYEFRF